MTEAPRDAPRLFVGVAGGTGSGKSTVAAKIAAALDTQCATVEYDAYYRDRRDLSAEERARINYDHPDALETELLLEHLRALRAGRAIEAPLYDFHSHLRRDTTHRITPAPVVIVEGIMALVAPDVRDLYDIKIFVDTDADIRLMRRIRRDLEQRGRSFQSVRDQYYRTVRPMHLQFVEPSKRWADIIVPEGGDNHVAIDVLLARLREAATPPATAARQ